MKRSDKILLIVLMSIAGVLIAFSKEAGYGAKAGLALAQNTIIPSLLPLLIIFFLIMKTGAKDVLSKIFGFICPYVFNLPRVAFPAIFFGLVGGYPTGALLTKELFDSGEIDGEQAKRMLCFNFCGGCGFIITAVGTAVYKSIKTGIILFSSNVISAVIIGFILSFTQKRGCSDFYSFSEKKNFADSLIEATNSAVHSVLNITAFIILFSAANSIIPAPKQLLPMLEITSGICANTSFPLPEAAAYLSFGGLCIHFQLLGIIKKIGMKYTDFFLFRVFSAFLSYAVSKLILCIFPQDASVFSNSAQSVAAFSSVNTALSILMVIGCFILVFDINSKRKLC